MGAYTVFKYFTHIYGGGVHTRFRRRILWYYNTRMKRNIALLTNKYTDARKTRVDILLLLPTVQAPAATVLHSR